ncbi:MAG: hypothetical protein DRM98_02545 [Thermoplasmata archaeon]|nr:MAG: hypothetical protein DRM98_02545 [Thermoplasmata archaeon]
MRFLILCLLIYFGYRVLKGWLGVKHLGGKAERDEHLASVDDVMVKDPYCGIYFPKRKAIEKVIDGEMYYFCSTECRDKYLEEKKKS